MQWNNKVKESLFDIRDINKTQKYQERKANHYANIEMHLESVKRIMRISKKEIKTKNDFINMMKDAGSDKESIDECWRTMDLLKKNILY